MWKDVFMNVFQKERTHICAVLLPPSARRKKKQTNKRLLLCLPLGGGRTPQHRLTKVLAWLYWLTKKCSVEKKMYEAVDMIKSRPNRQILCSARDNVCRKTTKLTNKVSLFVKLLLRLNLCAIFIVQLPPVFYTKPPCYSPIIINEIKRQNTLRKSVGCTQHWEFDVFLFSFINLSSFLW